MDGAMLEQYDEFQVQGGLGIFESYDQALIGAGMGVAQGGSRSSKASKKKPDVDEDDPIYTTVMLRNIPNKYTRQMLIDQLHRSGFRGNIDYMYLPVDFANRCNVGYCFVNFREALSRKKFVAQFDGVAAQSCLPGFNSYKVCQVTRAKWQGREENVRRLKSGPELMAQLAAHPEWLPLLLDSEGNPEVFHCDEGVTAARAPIAPRRQIRKKNQGGTFMSPEEFATAFPFGFPPEAYLGGDAMGRGKGGGRGKKGRGGGCMGAYSDSYAGMAMMPMPVMTGEYVSYDGASYDGGYFMPYMGDTFTYGGTYPMGMWGDGEFAEGFAAAAGMWGRGAGKQQRGRKRGAGASSSGTHIPTVVENEGLEVVDDELG
mmetsp:Transcript_83245/g.129916  ORF Transcript_83245/g.129916 Transcript_83245/m.129916 type:complete len:372 (-) Transcript_83245:140-1255(-)